MTQQNPLVTQQFSCTNWALSDDLTTAVFKYQYRSDKEQLEFSETVVFPAKLDANLYSLLDLLHIALGLSYYKAFPLSSYSHPYAMSEQAAGLWSEIINRGLGEFVFVNRLSFSCLPVFSAQPGITRPTPTLSSVSPSVLLGVGGGKDSIVAAEFLRRAGAKYSALGVSSAGRLGVIPDVCQAMGVTLHQAHRHIDPAILELNKRDDTYNGHVPFSLFVALIGSISALALGLSWFCVGNEAASDSTHAEWDGQSISHHWSKSTRFQTILNRLLSQLGYREMYFSALRPFGSLAITKYLARCPHYFEVFSSDSTNMKLSSSERTPKWDLRHPKTISTYALLTPWLPDTTLVKIFGADLAAASFFNRSVAELISDNRPLDCVGTPTEIRLALGMAAAQRNATHWQEIKHLIGPVEQDEALITPPATAFAQLPAPWDEKVKHVVTQWTS